MNDANEIDIEFRDKVWEEVGSVLASLQAQIDPLYEALGLLDARFDEIATLIQAIQDQLEPPPAPPSRS